MNTELTSKRLDQLQVGDRVWAYGREVTVTYAGYANDKVTLVLDDQWFVRSTPDDTLPLVEAAPEGGAE